MKHRIDQRLRLATADQERGAGTLEYVGIVVLAAILVAALLLVLANFQYRERVEQALCEITSLGQGDCGSVNAEERPAEDYIPDDECVMTADGQAASVKAGVLLTGGAGGDWLIETLADGTYRLTRGESVQGGVEVGIGFDVSATVDNHAYGAGAQADASADIVFGGGEVFHAGTRDEAEAILAARNVDTVKDGVVGDSGPFRWAVDQVHDIFGDTSRENAVPDEVFIEGGVELDGSAGANLTALDVNTDAAVAQTLGERTRTDGTKTDYFASAAELTGSLQEITPGEVPGSVKYGELSGTLAGKVILEVDHDAQGTVTAVRTRTSYTVDGTKEQVNNSASNIKDPNVVNEVTAELPIKSDADRATALRMLEASGIPYVPGLSDGFDVAKHVANRLGIYDATVDFFKASRDSGQVWRQSSAVDTTTTGFNFDAAWLAKVQVSAEATSTHRVVTSYDYWNGLGFTPRPGCVSSDG